MSRYTLSPLACLCVAALTSCAPQQTAIEQPRPDVALVRTPVGDVDARFGCDPALQSEFAEALAVLHHMMYEDARGRFHSIVERDPTCAMGHWGVAMTWYTPLWAPPTSEDLERGARAAERAAGLPQSDRERRFVEVVTSFFGGPERPYTERADDFEAAWRRAHEADPVDPDAQAFLGLAMLATAPAEDTTYAQQLEAGALLEDLLERVPRHPGAHHYLLHAYDAPPLAERAVAVSRSYAEIAPSMPHALHMPSHIAVRLGLWEDVAAWNRRSADAARARPVDGQASLHYLHALDYLAFAFLQQARDDEARAVLTELRAIDDPQVTVASAYASVAIPARIALATRDREAAATLQPVHADHYPWEQWPFVAIIAPTTRVLGAVHTGDTARAEAELAEVERLADATAELGDPLWTAQARAMHLTGSAWLAHARGDVARALEAMDEAARLQASVEKHPLQPGHVIDAWESYGELLLEADEPERALTAFERALARTPNQFHSLYGAGRSAQLLARTDPAREATARTYYERLLEVAADDASRPELEEARRYLGQAATPGSGPPTAGR